MKAVALLLLALCGCGSAQHPEAAREAALAERARDRGEHRSAARHYERAARAETVPRRAEEALYRAADAYARAEDLPSALALYRQLAAARDGERSARADFAVADVLERSGELEQARAHRLAALRRHPNSGLAARALSVHLDALRESGGGDAALAFLNAEQATLGQTELGETLAYWRARELDALGRSVEARDAYLACAERYPYPAGVYWDDALFRAAAIELKLGAPARGIAHLRRMLAEQESASFNGSYQRGRYAEAQLELARIYRDVLGDSKRARVELRRVWERHRTSLLVDDALFQEALLAKQSGDASGTCAPLSILVKELPDSRYAPCAHLLCPQLAALADRECRNYIQREAGLTHDEAAGNDGR